MSIEKKYLSVELTSIDFEALGEMGIEIVSIGISVNKWIYAILGGTKEDLMEFCKLQDEAEPEDYFDINLIKG